MNDAERARIKAALANLAEIRIELTREAKAAGQEATDIELIWDLMIVEIAMGRVIDRIKAEGSAR